VAARETEHLLPKIVGQFEVEPSSLHASQPKRARDQTTQRRTNAVDFISFSCSYCSFRFCTGVPKLQVGAGWLQEAVPCDVWSRSIARLGTAEVGDRVGG
jgi:hypothetical protein